jgi:hypothetical protein
VDIVRFAGASPATTAISSYVRLTDWTLASTGQDYTNAGGGAVSNPVALDNMPGPNKVDLTPANPVGKFPFGGFGRNGDMMLIPFVGSFSVFNGGTALSEVVPITLDVQAPTTTPGIASGQIKGRFTPDPANPATDWRSRIFENFTTQANPMKAFTPNIAPESWRRNANGTAPAAVTGVDTTVPGGDPAVPVQGLININTASREVLRMVPFATDSSGNFDYTRNDAIVEAILTSRRGNPTTPGQGPFRSVVDLMRLTTAFNTTGTPSRMQGNFLPTDVAVNAYAEKFHSFIRVSNLLTTRSDSLTVYVLLQQWQDYGSNKPVLLNETRYASVIDRSQLRDGNKGLQNIIQQPVSTE